MAVPASPIPLRSGTDAQFQALRSALDAAGYTEQAVCERLGLERIAEFRLEGPRHQEREPEDALGLLIWILMEGASATPAAQAKVPLAELSALGLLAPDATAPDSMSATVMLYPLKGCYVVSDRSRSVEGRTTQRFEDFVYPAIVANTEQYLALVPSTPCDAFLDLCSGTGIAGMVAARSGARHAWAFDITERSTQFAEFNRRLNAIPNLTAARGDLYEPAGDLTFDRIAAHAPYVPVFRRNLIFDSGGQDGEQIVRGVIEGLPRYLRPGGRFYAPMAGTDRDQPFQIRVREWLGPAEADFDIAFFVSFSLTPGAYIADSVSRGRGSPADAKPWHEVFDQLKIRFIQRGFLIMQRRDRPRPVFTVRRNVGPRSGPAEHHWLMDWETAVASDPAAVLALHPRGVLGSRLQVEHNLAAEGWVTASFSLHTDYPFQMEIPAEAWTAHVIASADGSRTTAQLLEALKADGSIHPDAPPMEFARVVAQLISGGFLLDR